MTMEKYLEPLTVDDTKNIQYYETTLPTPVEEEEIPFYYVSKEGDRLDSLASTFYGSSALWWVLAKANNLANGSIVIPVGTKVFIPRL